MARLVYLVDGELGHGRQVLVVAAEPNLLQPEPAPPAIVCVCLPEFAEALQLEVLERYRMAQDFDVDAQDGGRAVQDFLFDLFAGRRLEQVQAAESSAHDYETPLRQVATGLETTRRR